MDVFVYRIAKYIGAYYAILPALDAVVLTGGIGENSLPIRRRICRQLARLGAVPDERRNDADRRRPGRADHGGGIAPWPSGSCPPTRS